MAEPEAPCRPPARSRRVPAAPAVGGGPGPTGERRHTPEGALTHAITIYEDPASDLIREALLAREVRRLLLETALDQGAQRYGVTALAHMADSFRVGVRYGTRMAELLGAQSMQLRQAWFAAYRERITRAPILMTIPALLFFVASLLFLIFLLVFTPLVGALGRL